MSNILNVRLSAPELVNGGAFGDPSTAWVEAHCCDCRWTSGERGSQGEALAAHAAHQRLAHSDPTGRGGR